MTPGATNTPMLAAARLKRVRDALDGLGLEALYLRDTSNIAWATAFDGVFDAERAHALLLTHAGATLHTDSRYAAACRAAAQGTPIAIDDAKVSHVAWLADQFGAGTLGIEDDITLAEFRALEEKLPKVHITETHDVVRGLRAVKSLEEIERLRAAQAITDAAFAHIVDFVHPGLTEREVKVELEDFMLRHGAAGLAFPSIVATGPNGANPHAQPTDAPLEAGQCVVMDFGACACGYCSDMTRMLFLGEPSAELARAYEVLRAANEEVETMLAPGVTGAQAHAVALSVLEQGGFGGMGHGLGHGVGMEVHEDPVLAPRNTEALAVGNVVTVEPGIYVEGHFGMRLEDFGVITDSGFEVFTQSSHEMVII